MKEKSKKIAIAILVCELLSVCLLVFFYDDIENFTFKMRARALSVAHTKEQAPGSTAVVSAATATATAASLVASDNALAEISVAGRQFKTYVADTEALQEKGLSGRPAISADEAMLFPFGTPDYYGFWMKGMRFSVDMVWLDADRKIIFIKNEAMPESYPEGFRPDKKATYVIEFLGGTVKKLGFKIGDEVSIKR